MLVVLVFMLCVMGLIALLAAVLVFGLLVLGIMSTSAVYGLIRHRWSAILRAFVVQMSALLGAIFGAITLQLADEIWSFAWGCPADLIVGAAIGLILGVLVGLALNAIVSRLWRWARPRCDPKLDPADEARHK